MINQLRRIGAYMFILATTGALPLQAASINGYVVDAASREPLPVATVQVSGTDLGATTNLDGYFVINLLEPQDYTLKVSYLGYTGREIQATAHEGVSDLLYIEITPTALQLKEVEVVMKRDESREERMSPTVSTVPVEAKLVRLMPSLMGEMDVLRALQTIPGVKASSDLSSALYVRGGSTDQTLILMDHNTVYNPSHMFGLFSTFNADAVKHLELMKGGFPVYYGGRSGSVLEVITNEGNRKTTQGLVSLGIISARASIQGPLHSTRGSYALSARRTYMDPMLQAIRESQDIDLPDYYFYDANGKFNFDLSDRSTLTVAGYSGDDRLDLEVGPSDSRIALYMMWGNRTLTSRLRNALGSNMFGSVAASFSRYYSKWGFINEDVLLDKGGDKMDELTFRGDLEIYHRNHAIKAGASVTHYDIKLKEQSEDLVFVDVAGFGEHYSTYVQDRWRISPTLEALPGLRFYYHGTDAQQTALDPRLALVYHWDPTLRFKLAGGRYSQFLNLITFGEGFTNFDLWIPIDETLQPSYSDQIVGGVEWDLNGIEFTTETYYTDMNRLATFDPETDRGDVAAEAFVVGEGYASGVEWMARKKTGRLNGWIGYSLSWTKRRYPGSVINHGDWFYPKWDRRHDFIVVANYKLSRAWDLSGTWRYNTGQGFTQAVGVMRQRLGGVEEGDIGNFGRSVVWGGYNNYRFPADHKLDVTFSYNHLFFKLPAKLGISITNLYSRRAYWMRNFDYYVDPVEVTDIKLLPVIPMVNYEVRF